MGFFHYPQTQFACPEHSRRSGKFLDTLRRRRTMQRSINRNAKTRNRGVDADDLVILAANWLANDSNESNKWRNGADVNQDGQVNIADFAVLSSDWKKYIID